LRKKGLVTVRTGNNHGERIYSLTEKGEEALRTALPYWEGAQQRFKRIVGDLEWQFLMEVCRRAVDAAQKAEVLRAPNLRSAVAIEQEAA
jgi:DNA-binding PadR family transcriptional regulator